MAQDDIVHSRQRPHREDPQAVLSSAICARPIGNANWTCSLAPLCEWKNPNEVTHKGLVVTGHSPRFCVFMSPAQLSMLVYSPWPPPQSPLSDFCEKDWTLLTPKGIVVFLFLLSLCG